MEKLLGWVKSHIAETIFFALVIVLLGFFALPFLNVSLLNGLTAEGEANYTLYSLSIYQLMAGGMYGEANLIPDVTFILTFVLVAASLILVIVSLFINKHQQTLIGLSLILILSTAILFGVSEKIMKSYDYLVGWMEPYIVYLDDVDFNLLGFSLDLVVLIAMFLVLGLTMFKTVKFSVQEMVEMAMLIALALVLDKVKIPLAASGGSINLAGLPLLLLSIRYGPLKGFIGASLVFGIISCLIDGYGFQTYPFDYFIAFIGYAGAGLFYNIFKATILKNKESKGLDLGCMMASLTLGCIAVMITRMIGSSISSYLYFLSYISDDVIKYGSKFLAVFMYNIAYIGPSAAVSLAGALLLAKPMQMINARFPVKKAVEEEVSEAE